MMKSQPNAPGLTPFTGEWEWRSASDGHRRMVGDLYLEGIQMAPKGTNTILNIMLACCAIGLCMIILAR